MPKRDPTEAQLDHLASVRASPPPRAELARELRAALSARSAHVVAKAAQLAGELEVAELLPELRTAFEARMSDAVRRDPQCAAKTAVVRALIALEDADETVFVRGMRHVQHEPVWGGTVDTAAELRGLCGIGLAATGRPGALIELVRLLADAETQTRVLGTRAVASSGTAGAEEALRLKVLIGDAEREVLVEALVALLRIVPERSLAFARELLEGEDAPRAEAAALALGETRVEGAHELLAAALERGNPDPATTLLALATLRSEPALELLLSVVASGPGYQAREALRALGVHRDDEELALRVRSAVAERAAAGLSRLEDPR